MTICIGALCDGGNSVVVASDKMITASGVSTEFEHMTPKFEKVGENCVVLSAGTALVHKKLACSVRDQVNKMTLPPIEHIVKLYEQKYCNERISRAEKNHLHPRGINIKDFYGGRMQAISPDLAMMLDRDIARADLGLELLVAGVDGEGGHLHVIADPGVSESFDTIGFTAIGSGYLHSVALFMSCSYNNNWKLNEALYTVFEAKKKAEHAPGVGSLTDMAIITNGKGTKILDSAALAQLTEIYESIKTDEQKRLRDTTITQKMDSILKNVL